MLDAPNSVSAPPTVHRSAYLPPAFLVDTLDLRFELDPSATVVLARMRLRRNPAHPDRAAPLRLDGDGPVLLEVRRDGETLGNNFYALGEDGALTVSDMPDASVLETTVRIDPSANTALSGLYLSGGNFFTQCEAEGFRRITFFPDRPDVMARFTTTIVADASVPVLLSNGDPGAITTLADGRRSVTWADPHPKPSYLFALVAGDLRAVRDDFTTRSGRRVELAIWVRAGDEPLCGHAMLALKKSMTWDEEVFGLEYDLDVFNIAAVSDFNMGAMENKGLNVFNTRLVLASPDTATDADYERIESVIAHEYFHNWTGNRVTCRDWFQLSLKEGLTVFRDQEFSADQGSRALKRLWDVRRLRAAQFPEDDGPMAHPVRPDSYIEIDNFYTPTVYEKGAEVVRMLHSVLGKDGFRRGMDLYFQRHDNQAVTIEDFVAALADGGGTDLSPFLAWYGQAGTPEVTVAESYDAGAQRYTLHLAQVTKPTPEQAEKRPLPIPVAAGLLGPDGVELAGTRVLMLDQAAQDFVFADVPAHPVPSLLRGFSAPVRLKGLGQAQLRFLAAHDTDPFVRWDSGQQYATALMLERIAATADTVDSGLHEIFAATLLGADSDRAFAAEALVLPSEQSVADQMAVVDPEGIHTVREGLRAELGRAHLAALRATYDGLDDAGPYQVDGASIGRRSLRNLTLSYLAAAGEEGVALAQAQFAAGRNMTEVIAALSVLASTDGDARTQALAAFHERWRGDSLVIDKWFAVQAGSRRARVMEDVRTLYAHPDFDLRTPNRVYALVGGFTGNQRAFHAASGEGYRFLSDAVMALDPINGAAAARVVGPLGRWRRQDAARGAIMRAELERILALPGLSRGVFEKVTKALA